MALSQNRVLEEFQKIDAYEFEQFVAELWELQNWDTYVTKGSDDGGVDIIAEKSEPFPKKQVIQVKRYEPSNSVGRPDIQQYASIRQERTNVDTVAVVTTGRFTGGAEDVAKKLNVKLVEGSQLYNLIDALDAFQVARSYIRPEDNQGGITLPKAEDGATDKPLKSTNSVENPQSIAEFDEDTQLKNVPTFLPSLIKLRGEIIQDFQAIQSRLGCAEEAFDEQRYFDAVERYEEVNRQQIEVKRKIARYDAGFTHIDANTADHLPSTGTFTSHLTQITDGINDHFAEAFVIIERAKGLEFLVNEICDYVDTIENRINQGDQMCQNGDVEKGHSEYQKAKQGLEQTRQTMEIYQGLVTEYDDETIETHQGIPQEISLSELEDEITSRINSKEEHLNIPKIAEEATGSFSAKVLTGNRGELFDKELVEYLNEDEQLEFVFGTPKRGFKIRSPDGIEETPHGETLEAGACFLLVTDQRILYVAGVDDHDETRCFKFDQLSGVEVSTDVTSPNIVLTTTDGQEYEFAGMRNQDDDLEAAARFIKTRLE